MSQLLAAIIVMAISSLTMTGNHLDSLYRSYNDADKHGKIELVNMTAQMLFKDGVIDTQYQLDNSANGKLLDATMHYLQAEHLLSIAENESSLQEGMLARAKLEKKASTFNGNVLCAVSKAQFRLGQFDEALSTLLSAYDNDQKVGDKGAISSDLSSLALIYLTIEEPAMGITDIEKSIAIERQLNRPDCLAACLGIASELYLSNNEPEKALSAIEEAYNLDCRDNRKANAAVRLVQKGQILEHLARLDEAQQYILKAVPELTLAGNNRFLAIAFSHLASISQKEGKNEEAIDYYKKAVDYSIKGKSPKTERIAERGLWEMMRQDNPTMAMLHLERYTALTDSLIKNLVPVKAHALAITARQIESSELNENSSRLGKLLKWASIGLGILLALMLGGLFKAWRTSSRTLRLQRQTQAQRDIFFKNIAQELHTPISCIMSAGQQLLDGGKTSADEKQRLGTMIVNHSRNILHHVNNLIEIEKVDSSIDKPEPKCGDIVMFVRMLVDNFTELANQKFITLTFTSPKNSLTVTFVPDYLRRIVHNLISNAIKYTPRNGTVTVELVPLEPDKMQLSIKDTGKGIPVENRDIVFEPFYQTQNDPSGIGTGVELAVVKHIVNSMDGTIDFETELGKGTTFTIVFPVEPDHRQGEKDISTTKDFAEKRILPNGRAGQQRLVFIVEDHEDVAFFTANLLRDKYQLRFAHDGNEAFRNAQGLVPDLIITNTVLPGMDGKELIRKLRGSAALNHIPIIAFTSNTSEAERLSCFEAGADAVLVKPFNSSELCLMVSHFIRQQQVLREHYAKVSGNNSEDANKTQMSKEDKEFMNHLVDVIHVQMAKEDIDMEHIAAALSLSRKQLRTRVMALTGLTPVAYVLQVRLNYARHMISHKNTSLSTIANRCGFQNLSHFSKAFKQQFGVSPMQFRKSIDDIQQPLP